MLVPRGCALLWVLFAPLASGFLARPLCRPAAHGRAACHASPVMIDSMVDHVALLSQSVGLPGVIDMAPVEEADGGLLGRMMNQAIFVLFGIAGSYVTQGASVVQVDPDDRPRRRSGDRTLPPPRQDDDRYFGRRDDEWPWDDDSY